MPFPVRHESHGRPHAAHTPGVGIAANATDEQQPFAPRIRGGSAH